MPSSETTPAPPYTLILALAGAVAAAILLAIYLVKRKRRKPRILEKAVKCQICLGIIKTGSPVITCKRCGKFYHPSCATRVEKCPACGAVLSKAKKTKEKR